jgi:hypothetical protein
MAWTVPRTASTDEIWTSTDWNTYVKNNLLETFPGKATAALQYPVATGLNAIAMRTASSATTATSETRTSATYGDLSGGATGPAVTVTTGTAALVMWTVSHSNGSASIDTWSSVAISGATTLSASDAWGTRMDGVAAGNANRFGMAHLFTSLTAGSNTFTVKYRSSSGTATYVNRHIIAVPL